METSDQSFWRKCSSCKKAIGFGAKYFVCSVSTCNGQRTGYVFCSVSCFEIHLPGARHKDAAAIENRAPLHQSISNLNAASVASAGNLGVQRIVRSDNPSATKPGMPTEVLVIASRLKDYIHARAEMNSAAQVMDVLSDHLRRLCDRAIDNARNDGRKTVMARDFDFLK